MRKGRKTKIQIRLKRENITRRRMKTDKNVFVNGNTDPKCDITLKIRTFDFLEGFSHSVCFQGGCSLHDL